jgi:hypothetical protein
MILGAAEIRVNSLQFLDMLLYAVEDESEQPPSARTGRMTGGPSSSPRADGPSPGARRRASPPPNALSTPALGSLGVAISTVAHGTCASKLGSLGATALGSLGTQSWVALKVSRSRIGVPRSCMADRSTRRIGFAQRSCILRPDQGFCLGVGFARRAGLGSLGAT